MINPSVAAPTTVFLCSLSFLSPAFCHHLKVLKWAQACVSVCAMPVIDISCVNHDKSPLKRRKKDKWRTNRVVIWSHHRGILSFHMQHPPFAKAPGPRAPPIRPFTTQTPVKFTARLYVVWSDFVMSCSAMCVTGYDCRSFTLAVGYATYGPPLKAQRSKLHLLAGKVLRGGNVVGKK